MRYGLQPVNGDHLGVSTYRDYSLLLPAAKDQKVDIPTRKQLEQQSAESAGTSHPAIMLLQGASAEASKTDSLDGSRRREEHVERRHSAQDCGQGRGGADRSAGSSGRRGSGPSLTSRDEPLAARSRVDGTRVSQHGSQSPSADSGGHSRLKSKMMPVPLLIALLIAFGIEPPATGVPAADVVTRVLETFGGDHPDRRPGVRSWGLGCVPGVSHRVDDLAAPPGIRARSSADHLALAGGVRLDHSFRGVVEAGPEQLGPGRGDHLR